MADEENKTWLCPICGIKAMKYGETNCDGQIMCGNKPHVTGEYYCSQNDEGIWYINKKSPSQATSIGIAEIANQDEFLNDQ